MMWLKDLWTSADWPTPDDPEYHDKTTWPSMHLFRKLEKRVEYLEKRLMEHERKPEPSLPPSGPVSEAESSE